MVAAEKGVADSFGMTLDCQNFSLVVSVFCGRCVGTYWGLKMVGSLFSVHFPATFSTGELPICFWDDSLKVIRRYVCCA